MNLAISKTSNGQPTDFIGKILLCESVQPGPDYEYYQEEHQRAIAEQHKPKFHSLRIDAFERWRPGYKIHYCTGQRSPDYLQFGIGLCTSVQTVELSFFTAPPGIERPPVALIRVDGRTLKGAENSQFIQNDGFDAIQPFYDWFAPYCGKENYTKLRCIHWTDLHY